MRIGITGASGSGISALAKALASHYDVTYLSFKKEIRAILKREEYNWSSGIQVEQFLTQRGCQLEIADKVLALTRATDNFVADRTVVDVSAYAIIELYDQPVITETIINSCRKEISRYDGIVLCQWNDVLDNDQVRTLNKWYQLLVHTTIMGLLDEWGISYFKCDATEDGAVDKVKEHFLS